MKAAPLVAFLILGGAVAFVLWDANRRKPRTSSVDMATSNNPAVTQVDSLTKMVNDLSGQVTTLSGQIGKTAGGSVGSAGGNALNAGETEFARGIGSSALTTTQINDLSHNAAVTGLAVGATAGANASSAVGGAAGASPFDAIAAFFRGAAGSELLRPGGVADQLGLPKWG